MHFAYYHFACKEKLNVFWLTEDIKDFSPDIECEFLDDNFEYVMFFSKNRMYSTEFDWIFKFYTLTSELILAY